MEWYDFAEAARRNALDKVYHVLRYAVSQMAVTADASGVMKVWGARVLDAANVPCTRETLYRVAEFATAHGLSVTVEDRDRMFVIDLRKSGDIVERPVPEGFNFDQASFEFDRWHYPGYAGDGVPLEATQDTDEEDE